MSAFAKGVPLSGYGQVIKASGGAAPVVYMSVEASNTIKQGDILSLDGTSEKVEQAVDGSGLTTAGYGLRADVTGRTFIAMEDKTVGASPTDDDKIACVELTQDVWVKLCIINAPSSVGAIGAATNTTQTATKQNTVYAICRYTPDGTNSYYGLSITGPTGNAGLKIAQYTLDKAIAETYAMVYAVKPTADGR